MDKYKGVVALANIPSGWCAKNRDEKARFERPLYCTQKPSPTATPKHNLCQSAKSAVNKFSVSSVNSVANNNLCQSVKSVAKNLCLSAFVVKKAANQLVQNNFFMQNKANLYHGLPARGSFLNAFNTKRYVNIHPVILSENRQKNKAKQTQNEPNFELKMGLFSRNKPKTKPISVKIGKVKYRLRNEIALLLFEFGFLFQVIVKWGKMLKKARKIGELPIF